MFCIGVYETRKNRIHAFREKIAHYAIQTDSNIDILWLVGAEAEENLERYVSRMQLIFISMDVPGNKKLGDSIYRMNPDCRICYYKTEKSDLEPFLSARPIAFYLWAEKEEEPKGKMGHSSNAGEKFMQKLDELLHEILEAGGIFSYETRKTKHMIPIRDILYFQSNLKYVEIHTRSGADCRIYAKLSEIESVLAEENIRDAFLRIHKSYIVNLPYIESLDKVNHMIHLAGGASVPVSDACYGNVARRLSWT